MATCLHPTRVRDILYPCGKCPVCRQNMRQSKGDRFLLESAFNRKNGGSNFFLTLTYEDKFLKWCKEPCVSLIPSEMSADFNPAGAPGWYPCFSRRDFKTFFDYIRRKGYKFKYFLSTEYGSQTHRVHAHLILNFKEHLGLEQARALVSSSWHFGFIQISPLNDSRVMYAAKYVMKDDTHYLELLNGKKFRWDERKPFTLISKGFGDQAIDFVNEYLYNDGNFREFLEFSGKPLTLDQFFKRKIDPSIQAELRYMYEQRKNEIQDTLSTSRRVHSQEVDDGFGNIVLKKDFTKDMDIFKHRLRLQSIKKRKQL